MLAHRHLRSDRVATGDRLDDAAVVADDVALLARRGQVQQAQAVDVAAAPAHQFEQPGHAGGLVHQAVETSVGLDEPRYEAGPIGADSGSICARSRARSVASAWPASSSCWQ